MSFLNTKLYLNVIWNHIFKFQKLHVLKALPSVTNKHVDCGIAAFTHIRWSVGLILGPGFLTQLGMVLSACVCH